MARLGRPAPGRDSYIGNNILAADAFNTPTWMMGRSASPDRQDRMGHEPADGQRLHNPFPERDRVPGRDPAAAVLRSQADDPLNYGGIGAVIGHEMTHGYDDQGSRFGPDGNFNNWWTDADSKAFAARTKKLVDQFDGCRGAAGLYVKGPDLGENIADPGGINVAYDAMKAATAGTPDPMTDGMDRDQRFFLSFGTIWRGRLTPDYLR